MGFALGDWPEYRASDDSSGLKPRAQGSNGTGDRAAPFAEFRSSQPFHSPHAPRLRDEPPYLYDLHPEDDERLAFDYENAEDKLSMLDSERVELRDRMKAWLRFEGLEQWKDFRFSTPRERGNPAGRLRGSRNPLKAMSDEELDEALAALRQLPDEKPKRSNKVMDAADTAVGPRQCKPSKRTVPSPPGA